MRTKQKTTKALMSALIREERALTRKIKVRKNRTTRNGKRLVALRREIGMRQESEKAKATIKKMPRAQQLLARDLVILEAFFGRKARVAKRAV